MRNKKSIIRGVAEVLAIELTTEDNGKDAPL